MVITSAPSQSNAPGTLKLRIGRIKDLAELRGFGSVAGMAKQFGISRQNCNNLVNGTYLPRLPTAHRMALALGVTIDDLIDKDGTR